MNKIWIETSRLIIREFTLDDAKAVFEFGSNEEVQRYTGNELLSSEEEAANLIKNVNLKDYAKYGYGRWAVVHKADNKVIGFAGLKYLEDLQETDLGYRILPQYWDKGITTEASKPIIGYGFKQLKLKRIIGVVMQNNPASERVLIKLGFSYYQTAEYDGDSEDNLWYHLFNANES